MTATEAAPPASTSGPKLDSTFFGKRSDAVSLVIVVAHLALGLAPVYLAAAWGVGWHLIPLVLWFGCVMNGLLNLMHEASHFSVFRPRWASDVLGDWVLAPMVLADFRSYRARHWDHHRHLGTDRDTKDAYLVRIGGWRLLGFLLSCLMLREAIGKFRHQLGGKGGERPAGFPTWVLRGAVVQLALFGSLLWVAGGDWLHAGVAWIGVYHYGLASVTVFVATLRAVAEHQVDEQAPVVAGRAALRNFRDNPLSRLLFGAYGFSEHASHHLHPQVPSYRLGEATRDLVQRGRDDLALGPGYGPTLLRLFRRG